MRAEDQRTSEPRYVIIPRTLIFLTRDDYILLLHGAPDKPLWAGKYNGIGGHIEPGETPYASALRELREEAGVQGVSLDLRAVIHITLPDPPGIVLFVFVGDTMSDELCSSGEGEPVWVHRRDLMTLPLVEDLPHLLPRVLESGPVIFGLYTFTERGVDIEFEAL